MLETILKIHTFSVDIEILNDISINIEISIHDPFTSKRAHSVINILSLTYINNFILYSSVTKVSNDLHYNKY